MGVTSFSTTLGIKCCLAVGCFAVAFFSSLCDQAIYESCLGKQQIKNLVGLQEARIEKIKRKLDKEASLIADAEWHEKRRMKAVNALPSSQQHRPIRTWKRQQIDRHLSKDLQHFKKQVDILSLWVEKPLDNACAQSDQYCDYKTI